MSQEYAFEFLGTKEDFLKKIGYFNNDGNQFYIVDGYFVKIVDDEIHFGVERAGHSSGYWFISAITEHENKIEIKGTIQYLGHQNNSFLDTTKESSILKKFIDKFFVCLFTVIVAPFVFMVYIFLLFKKLFNKMLRRPVVELKTKEDKLFDLMENQLGCIRK